MGVFRHKDSGQVYDELLALEQDANEAEAVALEKEEAARALVKEHYESMKTLYNKDAEVNKKKVSYYDTLLKEL